MRWGIETHLRKESLAVVLVDRTRAEFGDLHHQIVVEILRLFRLEKKLTGEGRAEGEG